MIRVRNETFAPLVYGTVILPLEPRAVHFSTAGEWGTYNYRTVRAGSYAPGRIVMDELPPLVACEDVTIDVPAWFDAEKLIVAGEETLLRSRRGPGQDLHDRAFRVTREDMCGSTWGVLDEWDVLFVVRGAALP